MRLTFGTVKAACAKILNMNSSDARVLAAVNEACEELLYRGGKSVDTTARYMVCVSSGCLTWPREIETIEAWASCNEPGTVRNQFFEFLDNGPGQMNANDGSRLQLVDRMNAVAFDDVVGTGKKLAIYADGTEAAGTVLLRYYDNNGNKVYTTYLGEVIEGERVTIPAAGNYTLSTYGVMAGGLYDVQKPVTKRVIRLYEYDTVALTYRALAYYEPDETLPTYRRSLIPCLAANTGGTCTTQRVTVLAKRRFIPATGDDSVLIISNARAVKLACRAVKKEEDVGVGEAETYWKSARNALNEQLLHWQGDGVVAPMRIERYDLGGSSVHNMI
jgi:hypothetical protein